MRPTILKFPPPPPADLARHLPGTAGSAQAEVVPAAAAVPHWDAAARELWWRKRLVKRFLRDGANQRLLLAAFQAQGWAARIDDPFPARTVSARRITSSKAVVQTAAAR
jgi:hypothetical protein